MISEQVIQAVAPPETAPKPHTKKKKKAAAAAAVVADEPPESGPSRLADCSTTLIPSSSL